MKLSDIAKLACKHAYNKRKAGEAPTFLGLEGMLALMYDNIRRYGKDRNYNEMMDLAANALFALEISYEKVMEGVATPDQILLSPPEQKTVPDPIPEEFDGWQYSPENAGYLKEWLVNTKNWDLLPDDTQIGIEEVMAGDVDARPGGVVEEVDNEDESSEL